MMTSDEILDRLVRYGRPYLHCHNDMTWTATLTCNTSTEGADFNMKSGHNHPTALAALSELLRRTETAIALPAEAAPKESQPAIEHKKPTLLERLKR